MDRYCIRADHENGDLVEVRFTNGTKATVRGFATEEAAEHRVEDRWRDRLRRCCG